MKTEELAKLLGISELQDYLEKIDLTLENLISSDNFSLRKTLLRIIRNGGKRFRPILVIAAAKSQGKKIDDKIILGCAAVELVHIGTIVHDDIIDNTEVRWDMPTINKREGLNHAILVGDYLLALASIQATTISQKVGNNIANTIATMCDGQIQETADEFNIKRSIESYDSVIRKKTAALTSSACMIGGLCANLPNAQIEALAKYGESFGMAFQLVDDLLDFLSTTEVMGKPVGNDIKEGIYTYPLLIALSGEYSEQVKSWLGKHPRARANRTEIINILIKTGAIEATITEVRRHNNIAAETVMALGNNKVTEGLSKLPDIYLDWAIEKMFNFNNAIQFMS